MRPEVLDHELLVKAKELIKDEDHWAQGTYHSGHASGHAYCAVGALRAAKGSGDVEGTNAYVLLEQAIPKGFVEKTGRCIESFNDDDDTTHSKIMRLFNRAIAKAKQLATAVLRG